MLDGTLVMLGWPPAVVQSAGRWWRLVSSFPRALSMPLPPAVRSPDHHARQNGPGYGPGPVSCPPGGVIGLPPTGEPQTKKMYPLNCIRAQGGH